jgi:hypothetical protein
MSPEVVSALIGAVVGGGISAGAGWLLQIKGEQRRETRLRKLFEIVLMDDLAAAPELFARLRDDLYKTGLVWRVTLNEIIASRDLYWKYKEQLMLFDADLRKALAAYYLKTQQSLTLLDSAQKGIDNAYDAVEELARRISLEDGSRPDEAKEEAKEILQHQVGQAEYSKVAVRQEMDKLVGQIDESKRLHKMVSEYQCRP